MARAAWYHQSVVTFGGVKLAMRRCYMHAEAVAHSLERAEEDGPSGHYEAVKPWVAITGVEYPKDGTPRERLEWYRHERYYARLVQDSHLNGKRFNLLVTTGKLFVPYKICTLRCPHCGRRVTDTAHFSPLASQDEYNRLKLADMAGQL